jgi:hypothetical protein
MLLAFQKGRTAYLVVIGFNMAVYRTTPCSFMDLQQFACQTDDKSKLLGFEVREIGFRCNLSWMLLVIASNLVNSDVGLIGILLVSKGLDVNRNGPRYFDKERL